MEKQLLSGEFRSNGTNSETNVAYNITEGTFTDISYTMQEN
ncbi:hypothetical protein [Aggregatimonas sangjinii]|nr:hypothetical protein [Aggregatimonas sangjinii]